MEEQLILVDENDNIVGHDEKMRVHKQGLLHRAFSVFIFNTEGHLLLQQRSKEKYHSPGLWTNTCCSHPRKGEQITDAVNRRLMEEMTITCPVEYLYKFTYKAPFDNGLIEYEIDHVFFGISDVLPVPHKEEVSDWKYMSPQNIITDLNTNPDTYTAWFKICFPHVYKISTNFLKTSLCTA